jgi:zinc protease
MLDRTQAPPFHIPKEVPVKQVNSTTGRGNTPIHFLQSKNHPVVRVELLFRTGKLYENKPGQLYFTFKLLREGTNKFSSSEISALLDKYGAHVEIETGNCFSSISVYSLEKHLEHIIPVLQEIIYAPSFPEKELEEQKRIYLQQLAINQKKNSYIASKEFKSLIFGNQHPLAHEITEQEIISLSREDLLSFYKNNLDRFELIIAGGYTSSTFQKIEASLINSEFKKNSRLSIVNANQNISELIIDKKESLQTSVRMGKLMLPKTNPDFHKLKITNHILGGYFGSRLMKNIREDKGYTYGIYSNIIPFIGGSYVVIGTDVKKQNREDTKTEIFRELETLTKVTISYKELEIVKNNLIGSFQADLNTTFALIDKFKAIYLYGLDYTYYSLYMDAVKDIQPAEITEICSKYFQTENFSTVMVG